MRIVIDTSALSAHIVAEVRGQIFSVSHEGRGTVEALPGLLSELLAKFELDSLSELQEIGVITGPGSFTGLRAGIAYAQGIAAALEIPLIGVSSLFASIFIARDFSSDKAVLSYKLMGHNDYSYAYFSSKKIDGSLSSRESEPGLVNVANEGELVSVMRKLAAEESACLFELSENLGDEVARAALAYLGRRQQEDSELGLHLQSCEKGLGLELLYGKRVAAKTLIERGVVLHSA